MFKMVNKRILIGDEVYIEADTCADCLETTTDDFLSHCKNVEKINGINCVTEKEFNFVSEEYYPGIKPVSEYTHVDTLSTRMQPLHNFFSLEKVFANDALQKLAGSRGMTIDEYFSKIRLPEEAECKKEMMENKIKMEDTLLRFKESLKRAERYIPEKYGLQLKVLSVIEKKYITFKTFICGNGIFFETGPEYIMEDGWNESMVDENGSIHVPSENYRENEIVFKNVPGRDFRKYPVIDSILYCMKNYTCENEWTDEICFNHDNINLSVSMYMLMKMMNKNNCPDVYFFEGALESTTPS